MTEKIVLINTQRVQLTMNLTHKASATRKLYERSGATHGSRIEKRMSIPGSLTILARSKSEPVPAFWSRCPEIANAIKAGKLRVEEVPDAPAASAVTAPPTAPVIEVIEADATPEADAKPTHRRR